MLIFTIMLMTSMIISMIMISLNFILSKKMWQDREKLTPFECGFDPINSARLPFSINFFLISLIFLIFDIEIMLLIPMILTIKNLTSNWMITTISIILILLLGIYLEWNENSIKWI